MMSKAEPEVECSEPWTTVIGKGKRGFISSSLPSHSLWIERKIFCAFPLIPGRTIRVIEMLSDRRFTVDFKSNELPWLIGALREAGTANSGFDFSKLVTIGRRSLVLSTVSNRVGVFIKLMCSFGGKNRRLLFIPAGEKGGGWCDLANLLASVSAGGNSCVKKPVSPPFNHHSSVAPILRRDPSVLSNVSFAEAVRGQARLKDKIIDASGWKKGFLPDFLELGINLSLGAPSSSCEASRRFAWKSVQSEFGSGTLVVEKAPSVGSPCLKRINGQQELGCMKSSNGGAGSSQNGSFVGFGGVEETKSDQGDDGDGDSILGNSLSPIQKSILPSGAPVIPRTDPLAGGPLLSSGLVPLCFVASRDPLSHVEHMGTTNLRAEENQTFHSVFGPGYGPDVCSSPPAATGLADSAEADPHLSKGPLFNSSMGFSSGGSSQVSGLGSILAKPLSFSHVFSKKAIESPPFLAPVLRAAPPRGGFGVGPFLSSVAEEESSPEVTEVSNPHSGDFSPPMDDSVAIATDMNQNSLVRAPPPVPFEAPVLPWLRDGPNELRFLASHAEVTIVDGEEEDPMASPIPDNSGCKDVLGKETGADVGYSVPEDFIPVIVHEHRVSNFVEKLSNMGIIHHSDRAGIQALLIKELVQDSTSKILTEEGLSPVAVLEANDLEDAAFSVNEEVFED